MGDETDAIPPEDEKKKPSGDTEEGTAKLGPHGEMHASFVFTPGSDEQGVEYTSVQPDGDGSTDEGLNAASDEEAAAAIEKANWDQKDVKPEIDEEIVLSDVDLPDDNLAKDLPTDVVEHVVGEDNDGDADDPDEPEKSSKEKLDEAVKLLGIVESLGEQVLVKLKEAEEDPDADLEKIEQEREHASAALESTRAALADAKDIVEGEEDNPPRLTLEELIEFAGKEHDKQVAITKRISEEHERKQAIEAEKRRPKTEEDIKLAETIKQKDFEELNNKKARLLLKMRTALDTEYYGMKTAAKTMYMFPDNPPMKLLGDVAKEEPWLECYYGMINESEFGHPSTRFRSIVTVDPEKGYTIENQAIRPFSSGLRGVFSDRWGVEEFESDPEKNPIRNLDFTKAAMYMQKRLKEADEYHDSKFMGRLLKAAFLAGALGLGAYLSSDAEGATNQIDKDQPQERTYVLPKKTGSAEILRDPDFGGSSPVIVLTNDVKGFRIAGLDEYNFQEEVEEPGF